METKKNFGKDSKLSVEATINDDKTINLAINIEMDNIKPEDLDKISEKLNKAVDSLETKDDKKSKKSKTEITDEMLADRDGDGSCTD